MAKTVQFSNQLAERQPVPRMAVGAEFAPGVPEAAASGFPEAIAVHEMPGDEELVRETRKSLLALKVGEITTQQSVESNQKPIRSLYDALLRARNGDTNGRELARANVGTHAMETVFKSGNHKRVNLDVSSGGDIAQNGQPIDDVHKNAYRYASSHPVLAERTIAEASNGARIKWALNEGWLEDNYFVVFSLCPEGLSDEELDELLFFSKTKSMSIQLTGLDGSLYTETAFVAGVADEGAERHDREAVEQVAERLGMDYSSDSTAQIINKPMFIPKYLLPNGLTDLVKMLDDVKGTFFGQNKPPRDYEEFKQFCAKREASFDGDVDSVTEQLIMEADILGGPVSASQRLAKLVEERMVKKAVHDTNIESWVFGAVSSRHIDQARLAIQDGKFQASNVFERAAVETAQTGACTAGSCGLESVDTNTTEGQELVKKLKAKPGDKLVKDKERSCKCGKKSIVYAYNAKKVTKYCSSCLAFESKVG